MADCSVAAIEGWEAHTRSLSQRLRDPTVTIIGDGSVEGVIRAALGPAASMSGSLEAIGAQFGSYIGINPLGVESTSGVDSGCVVSAIAAISIACGGVCVVVPRTDHKGFPQRHRLLGQLAEAVQLAKMCSPLIDMPTQSQSETGGFSATRLILALPNHSPIDDVVSWLFKPEPTYSADTAERDEDASERNGSRMLVRAAVGVPDVVGVGGLSAAILRGVTSRLSGWHRPTGWEVACSRLKQLHSKESLTPLRRAVAELHVDRARQFVKSVVGEEFYSVCRRKSQQGILTQETLQLIHTSVKIKIDTRIDFLISEHILDEGAGRALSSDALMQMAAGMDTFKTRLLAPSPSPLDAAASGTSLRLQPSSFRDRIRYAEGLGRARASLIQARDQTSLFIAWYQSLVDNHVPRQYRFWLSGHGLLITLGLTFFVLASFLTGRGEK
jgi:hypothetical protein